MPFDAALARSVATPDEVGWRLFARYAGDPVKLPDVAHHGTDLVRFWLDTRNLSALRGVARRLPNVAPGLREDVAVGALEAILTAPAAGDGPAAAHVYRALGPRAGLAMLPVAAMRSHEACGIRMALDTGRRHLRRATHSPPRVRPSQDGAARDGR